MPAGILEFGVAVHRGHLHLRTQGGLGEVDGQLDDDVVALSPEVAVGLHGHHNVEIAPRPVVVPRLTLAGQTNLGAVVNAGGHIDLEGGG